MAKIAIIETGGKQYVVTQDSILDVEKMTGVTGTGAKVSAELVEEGRNPTINVIRYRQKSRYFKKRGHRQPFAKVRITALP